VVNYDVSTTLELGKFFPAKTGVKIPFTFQYANTDKTPEYDPYDLDIKLKDKLRKADESVKDSLKSQAITRSNVRNISFDNVRKEAGTGGKRKPMPWSVSNFAVSYQNTLDRYSDPIIENETKVLNKGQLDYNYNFPSSTAVTPLKNLIKKDKYLKLFSEFNFNPLPSNVSFNSNVILLRLSEMYLIKAEAAALAANAVNSEALDAFNKLKLRNYGIGSYTPETTTDLNDFLTKIRFQRRVELIGEFGDRYAQLKRLKLPLRDGSTNYAKYLFKIPQEEMASNELMVQNP
jgi:cell surface protein SprA